MKRIFAVMLCILTVVTLFAACGEGTPAVKRIKELDGTVWPLTAQSFSDGTGYTAEELDAYGLYGCISFSGGKYTFMLDTSPINGDYNVTKESVELVDAYTLSRDGATLTLDAGSATLTFTLDPTLTPVDELSLDGTEWKLSYMKNDSGVYSAAKLDELDYSGTLTFDGDEFMLANDYAGSPSTTSGTYESLKAIVTLAVEGESIYGFINGGHFIIAESGISMVYDLVD